MMKTRGDGLAEKRVRTAPFSLLPLARSAAVASGLVNSITGQVEGLREFEAELISRAHVMIYDLREWSLKIYISAEPLDIDRLACVADNWIGDVPER